MLDVDDDPFSGFKSSIGQLRQRDENLIPNDFTYKDILTVDDDIAVMEGVMTDEEIVQNLIEIDGTITKPTTEEIRRAIDTLVNFSMFSQSGKIGKIALKASKLFEKELCDSVKQTFVSDFFEKK